MGKVITDRVIISHSVKVQGQISIQRQSLPISFFIFSTSIQLLLCCVYGQNVNGKPKTSQGEGV